MIAKIVKPQDADWNTSFAARDVVARPTCIAVRTIAIYTETVASHAKCSRRKSP
jgi:hypothetical protein